MPTSSRAKLALPLFALLAAMAVAAVLLVTPARADAGDYFLAVNRQQNVVTVYADYDGDGNYTDPVKAMRCATGKGYSSPAGWFKITDRYEWHMLNGGVWGQYCLRYTQHCLFHSVYYYQGYNKGSISESRYNMLGTQASDGCINLTVADAKWLYDNCPSYTTTVHVYDSPDPGPLGKPETVSLDAARNWGWDPTDPDTSNAYYANLQSIYFSTPQGMHIGCGGGTGKLTIGYNCTGYVEPLGAMIVWSSANPDVATVDQAGNVTGKNPGTATIVASNLNGNLKAYYTVTVDPKAKSVSLPPETQLLQGEKVRLDPTTDPASAAWQQFTWESSDTSVATVDANGNITAVGPGSTTITVKTDPNLSEGNVSKTGTGTVNVVAPTVRFVDSDDSLIFEQTVPYGGKIDYPEKPTKEGKKFERWAKDYDYATMTLTLKACYVEVASLGIESVDKGAEAPAPAVESENAVDDGAVVTDEAGETEEVAEPATDPAEGDQVTVDEDEGEGAPATDGEDEGALGTQEAAPATDEGESDEAADNAPDDAVTQPAEGEEAAPVETDQAVEETVLDSTLSPMDAIDEMELALRSQLRPLDQHTIIFNGSTRYMTCMRSATKIFENAPHVIIATGALPYDALAAAGLAGATDAPVIYTDGSSLSWEAYWALTVLNAQSVTVVGGPAAVSDNVVAQLQDIVNANTPEGTEPYTVKRVAGDDRVATANAIFAERPGKWGSTALLVSSRDFADAASAAPFASAENAPVFLADADGPLRAQTLDAIKEGGFTKVIIVGGPNAVSTAAENQVKAAGVSVERLGGADRYATSMNFANWAVANSSTLSWNIAAFATGQKFPDSISGATSLGIVGGVLVLVDNSDAGKAHVSTFHAGSSSNVLFYGGEAVMPKALRDFILGS